MAVCVELKSCCLDDEGWLWIKLFYAQKYGQQSTANLYEHYEGCGKFNKRVAWVTANIL